MSESPQDHDHDYAPSLDAQSNESQTELLGETSTSATNFSWPRVALTVLVVMLVGGGIAGGVWYVMTSEPPMFPVRGVVYLDGKPMTDGVIMTFHTGGWQGALAVIDETGQFELQTDGKKGAYKGEHKVTISLTDGKFPPKSLIPDIYGSTEETPLRIVVNSATHEKPVKLELTGGPSVPNTPKETE